MYIKLNSLKLNNNYKVNDFIIMSEVVDSPMSYEIPILVRTIDELNIWFGKDFSDYNYLSELLRCGVTLYLYKPISTKYNVYDKDFIDLTKYNIDNKLYYSIQELPKKYNIIYKVANSEGKLIQEDNIKYDNYIYYLNDFILISELPQNLNPIYNTESINNRDTLSIYDNSIINLPYSYPEYIYNGDSIYKEQIFDLDSNIDWVNELNNINKGYKTFSISITFSDSFENIDDLSYIILRDLHKNCPCLIYFSNKSDEFPNIDKKYYSYLGEDEEYHLNYIRVSINRDKKENIKNLLEKINEIGYKIINTKDINTYLLLTNKLIEFTDFISIPGVYIESNVRSSHNIIYNNFKNKELLVFVSKTIGSYDDLDSKIGIKIESLSINSYRITISRFNYSEVYEGDLNNLDYIISNNSKLVNCTINKNNLTKETKIKEGYYYLFRGFKENYDVDMFWKSLEYMYNPISEQVYFDYLLIPDKDKFFNRKEEPEKYKILLDYIKLNHSQVLIQNNFFDYKKLNSNIFPKNPELDTIYSINNRNYIFISNNFIEITNKEDLINYSGDFIYNYLDDLDNNILYFIGKFQGLDGLIYPGYYSFIRGLLQDIYSSVDTNNKIYLNNDMISKSYDTILLDSILEKYKCNYMNNNSFIYYYSKYQNGKNYITSGWLRFCIGKINRELEKSKWKFLSYKSVNEIKDSIFKILKRVSDSFSLISNINIEYLDVNWKENKLYLSINTSINDLINNDMKLNIILNFNK